jgi:N utilization substance protein B
MQDRSDNSARARGAARRLLIQALYQRQMAAQPWQELHRQFSADPAFERADPEYFGAALRAVCDESAQLDEELRHYSDIDPARLDPVEHAILYLGLWELMTRPDIPYRVVINEAVELAKRFGATDGHRYVNAVLDKASRVHRGVERGEVA